MGTRVLKARNTGRLSIEAGTADLRIVVDHGCQNIEAALAYSGLRSKETVDEATLENGKLIVPDVADTGIKDDTEPRLEITLRIPGSVAVSTTIRRGDIFANALLCNATLYTNRGGVSVHNVDGNTTLYTNGGSVSINSMMGLLKVTAYQGDIVLGSAVSGRAFLDTDAGHIYAGVDPAAGLVANTMSGDIIVHGDVDPTDVTARSINGTVTYRS